MTKHFTSELNEALLASLLENVRVRNADMKAKGYFSTPSGHDAFVHAPEESFINISDIALSLSRVARWGGRTRVEELCYSVAEHSVMVSHLCKPEHALIGLLHDATEAYIGDIISPLKKIIGREYLPIEVKWAKEIGSRFGLGDKLAFLPVDVQCADLIALEVERHDIMKPRVGGDVWGAEERPTNLPKIIPVDEYEAYTRSSSVR
jgi:hypothetical protein